MAQKIKYIMIQVAFQLISLLFFSLASLHANFSTGIIIIIIYACMLVSIVSLIIIIITCHDESSSPPPPPKCFFFAKKTHLSFNFLPSHLSYFLHMHARVIKRLKSFLSSMFTPKNISAPRRHAMQARKHC